MMTNAHALNTTIIWDMGRAYRGEDLLPGGGRGGALGTGLASGVIVGFAPDAPASFMFLIKDPFIGGSGIPEQSELRNGPAPEGHLTLPPSIISTALQQYTFCPVLPDCTLAPKQGAPVPEKWVR